jgi:DNA polymerase III delta prime subunit
MEQEALQEEIVERVRQALREVASLYHRLVLLVGPSGAGKTGVLRRMAGEAGYPLVNVGACLSRSLLELTGRQRVLQLPRLLRDLVLETAGEVVLLDNLEGLFHPVLKQDPLRLLQDVSRHRSLVAAWSGVVEKGYLVYARPGHPEHRRYPLQDLVIVHAEAKV